MLLSLEKMSQNFEASPLIKLEVPIASWLKGVKNKCGASLSVREEMNHCSSSWKIHT